MQTHRDSDHQPPVSPEAEVVQVCHVYRVIEMWVVAGMDSERALDHAQAHPTKSVKADCGLVAVWPGPARTGRVHPSDPVEPLAPRGPFVPAIESLPEGPL